MGAGCCGDVKREARGKHLGNGGGSDGGCCRDVLEGEEDDDNGIIGG